MKKNKTFEHDVKGREISPTGMGKPRTMLCINFNFIVLRRQCFNPTPRRPTRHLFIFISFHFLPNYISIFHEHIFALGSWETNQNKNIKKHLFEAWLTDQRCQKDTNNLWAYDSRGTEIPLSGVSSCSLIITNTNGLSLKCSSSVGWLSVISAPLSLEGLAP